MRPSVWINKSDSVSVKLMLSVKSPENEKIEDIEKAFEVVKDFERVNREELENLSVLLNSSEKENDIDWVNSERDKSRTKIIAYRFNNPGLWPSVCNR